MNNFYKIGEGAELQELVKTVSDNVIKSKAKKKYLEIGLDRLQLKGDSIRSESIE